LEIMREARRPAAIENRLRIGVGKAPNHVVLSVMHTTESRQSRRKTGYRKARLVGGRGRGAARGMRGERYPSLRARRHHGRQIALTEFGASPSRCHI
jgi:hypothetical protein